MLLASEYSLGGWCLEHIVGIRMNWPANEDLETTPHKLHNKQIVAQPNEYEI